MKIVNINITNSRAYYIKAIMQCSYRDMVKYGVKLTESDLAYAIAHDNIVAVKRCIESGVSANFQHGYGVYLAAVRKSCIDILRYLILHRASVNYVCCHSGDTALSWAAYYGRSDIVKLLCENGANIHYYNGIGYLNIMDCAIVGHDQETIRYLEGLGANRTQSIRQNTNTDTDDEHEAQDSESSSEHNTDTGDDDDHEAQDSESSSEHDTDTDTDTDTDDDDEHGTRITNPRASYIWSDCSICSEKIAKRHGTYLSCKHAYHTSCLLRWIIRHRSCPMCRARIK